MRRRAVSFFLLALISVVAAVCAASSDENTYPTSERLFHISRSLNKNLVCYDANIKNGRLDTKSPINVYWVNREEHPGERGSLSFIQKKMAYGYKVVSHGADYSEVTLTAHMGKTLKICMLGGKYVCTTIIDGKAAILQSLYVQSHHSNPLSVDYVELRGITVDTGAPVSEKVRK